MTMDGRAPFGYVVSVEGSAVRLNLLDAHRGQVASHHEGVSPVTEIGGLFAVDAGTRLLVLRVRSLSFAEAREAHRAGVGTTSAAEEPLRHLEATVVGSIRRVGGALTFVADSLLSPALGTEAYPLSESELACVLGTEGHAGPTVNLGLDTRGGGRLLCGLSQLLGRHVAVLGSTGQGKSCFTAAILQQMAKLPNARVVIFDINGEYADALVPHLSGDSLKRTVLGGAKPDLRIPYYALGRHGLARLLMPSEKTQRPALTFALEGLSYCKWFPKEKGAGLVDSKGAVLFDDARPADGNGPAAGRSRGAPKAKAIPRAGGEPTAHRVTQRRPSGNFIRVRTNLPRPGAPIPPPGRPS